MSSTALTLVKEDFKHCLNTGKGRLQSVKEDFNTAITQVKEDINHNTGKERQQALS